MTSFEKFCSYDDLFIWSTNFFIVGHICKYNNTEET